MRPKKQVLLIDSSEERRSVRKFVLETRGFIVHAVGTALDAADLARKFYPNLVIAVLPFEGGNIGMLLNELHRRHPMVRQMVIAERLTERPEHLIVDTMLLKGQCSDFEIVERVRMLSVGKRGPRGIGLDGELPASPTAYPGVMETVAGRTA